jgi:hypothetical protein
MPATTIRRIDFAYYDGLAQRTLDDIRSAEDALVAQQDQQARRDQLYATRRADLQERFRVGETATLQIPSQSMIENPTAPKITTANAPVDPADESVFLDDLETPGPPRMEKF